MMHNTVRMSSEIFSGLLAATIFSNGWTTIQGNDQEVSRSKWRSTPAKKRSKKQRTPIMEEMFGGGGFTYQEEGVYYGSPTSMRSSSPSDEPPLLAHSPHRQAATVLWLWDGPPS
ncbi:hypothetical protein L1987_36864 [Smallanthus sonchifolius]|uniref:Uncharacterized protein n=1 Tax=Smallanthus sonchifolius TaxID=185202 RepID=A0ACB9HER8_9ASTR|nr:hypothetical protein L1987_36864 [Smallanthus sonchifolius]